MFFRSQKKTAGDISLSDYLETGKDGTALSVQDVVASSEDLYGDLVRKENVRKLYSALNGELTNREKQVIMMRYGLGGYRVHRQQEVAASLGISRSYVSRIEKKALEKLRSALQ
jgi:RNA polymerase sporulation-specific sigma factor